MKIRKSDILVRLENLEDLVDMLVDEEVDETDIGDREISLDGIVDDVLEIVAGGLRNERNALDTLGAIQAYFEELKNG